MNKTQHDLEFYEIRVKGHLDERWGDWFAGLTLSHESNGTTVLGGPLTDQAALHGVLKKIRDLGLTLLSVNRFDLDWGDSLKEN